MRGHGDRIDTVLACRTFDICVTKPIVDECHATGECTQLGQAGEGHEASRKWFHIKEHAIGSGEARWSVNGQGRLDRQRERLRRRAFGVRGGDGDRVVLPDIGVCGRIPGDGRRAVTVVGEGERRR